MSDEQIYLGAVVFTEEEQEPYKLKEAAKAALR